MARIRDSYTDHHAPVACQDALNRPAPRIVRYDSDEIDDACPVCTPSWSEGGWRHQPDCIARHVPLLSTG